MRYGVEWLTVDGWYAVAGYQEVLAQAVKDMCSIGREFGTPSRVVDRVTGEIKIERMGENLLAIEGRCTCGGPVYGDDPNYVHTNKCALV